MGRRLVEVEVEIEIFETITGLGKTSGDREETTIGTTETIMKIENSLEIIGDIMVHPFSTCAIWIIILIQGEAVPVIKHPGPDEGEGSLPEAAQMIDQYVVVMKTLIPDLEEGVSP